MPRRYRPLVVPTPLPPETRDLWCQQTIFRPGNGRQLWTALLHPDDVQKFSRLSLEAGAEQGDETVLHIKSVHGPRYIAPVVPLKS